MENQKIADGLLTPLWRGIPDGYKRKYARSIWSQFEDNLRSAAYTSSLGKFLGAVCAKLGINVRATELTGIQDIVGSGCDREVLGKLRDETTHLVLLVRLTNEERKEQFAAKQATKQTEKAKEEALDAELGF